MHEALRRMVERYEIRSLDEAIQALREIIQEVALLGLWRSKFFEHAAFYGGSALRILHDLDRYSEDLDFSLLRRQEEFNLARYTASLEQELSVFGFDVQVELVSKAVQTPIQSAFLKADTLKQLLVIQTGQAVTQMIPPRQKLKVKIEVDTDPPKGFVTETRYVLQPIPFAVRSYVLSDLFAGKMHAALCRRWKKRVKGRDWYDLVWYATHHPELHLSHLEHRMRQTGDWKGNKSLSPASFRELLSNAIDRLDVDQARREAELFVKYRESLTVWSHEFFQSISERIMFV